MWNELSVVLIECRVEWSGCTSVVGYAVGGEVQRPVLIGLEGTIFVDGHFGSDDAAGEA